MQHKAFEGQCKTDAPIRVSCLHAAPTHCALACVEVPWSGAARAKARKGVCEGQLRSSPCRCAVLWWCLAWCLAMVPVPVRCLYLRSFYFGS